MPNRTLITDVCEIYKHSLFYMFIKCDTTEILLPSQWKRSQEENLPSLKNLFSEARKRTPRPATYFSSVPSATRLLNTSWQHQWQYCVPCLSCSNVPVQYLYVQHSPLCYSLYKVSTSVFSEVVLQYQCCQHPCLPYLHNHNCVLVGHKHDESYSNLELPVKYIALITSSDCFFNKQLIQITT